MHVGNRTPGGSNCLPMHKKKHNHFLKCDTGKRCMAGFFRGTWPAHWSANEWDPFVPRLVLTFRKIGDTSRNSFTFVHALDVFVSFTPLLSLYKKDCDYVKASWTEIRCSSSRQPSSREGGPNRLFPESLRPGRSSNLRTFLLFIISNARFFIGLLLQTSDL
jgi:hypothetical protein